MGKKLFIIDNEKESAYALLLLQLISARDDNAETGEIVGIKDGSVDASLWTEKEYNDSRAKIVSSNKIIFVGLSDTSEAISKNIVYDSELSKWGIYIGWLGNIGVIYSNPKVLMKDSNLYAEFYSDYAKTFSEISDTNTAQNTTDKVTTTTKKVQNLMNKGLLEASKGMHFVKNAGKKLYNKVANENVELTDFSEDNALKVSENVAKIMSTPGLVIAPIATGVKHARNEKEINEQIYRYMVFKFYNEHLSKFMELDS